ncbi:MAG: tRNA ((37)-N6)-threonylcarbamoyltransferase complex transferase subunit TsaD [Bacillota bacterium]|jgi:N6-L-threonylcarbamoyladenine synthase
MTVNKLDELIILGIETSCDETAVAIVRGTNEVLANVIATQEEIHQRFGGIVPELASRQHVKQITLLLQRALQEAGLKLDALDAIAVTQGPGLVGALLIGVMAAKTLSWVTGLPLIGVQHLAGHIYANHLKEPLTFPLVALIVSGGHTELIYMREHLAFKRLGGTLDDAVGEAFDKVARLLGLPYPGGPSLEKLAEQGCENYKLPRAWLGKDSLDFSFSGLKSSVMNLLRTEDCIKEDVAASFQAAAIEVLVEKSISAIKETGAKNLVLAGGVAANKKLRHALRKRAQIEGVKLSLPQLSLCTDNAVMIATVGTFLLAKGEVSDLRMNVEPNLKLSF